MLSSWINKYCNDYFNPVLNLWQKLGRWYRALIPVKQRTIWWGITKFGIPAVWDEEKGDKVIVAVIDSGLRQTKDIRSRRILETYNALDDTNNVEDEEGHGTTCTGIIAGEGNNAMQGIAPECWLIIIKAKQNLSKIGEPQILEKMTHEEIDEEFDRIKTLTVERTRNQIIFLCKSFEWILRLQNPVDIISISMSVKKDSEFREEIDRLAKAINACLTRGIVIVGSAGNEIVPKIPGICKDVISVNGLDEQGLNIHLYNNVQHLTCAAPGSDVYYAYNVSQTGVSFATAFTSGVLALSISKYKRLHPNAHQISPSVVKERLEQTAIRSEIVQLGHGILCVESMMTSPV